MNHEIHVVEQHPFRLLVTLHMSRMQARFVQSLLDLVGDRLNLAWIRATADHKVIGEGARSFFQLKYGDFFGLLFLACADSFRYLSLQIVFFHSVVGFYPFAAE